jgi:hypothetical protein
MIYRIEITNRLTTDLTIGHHFEAVIDDTEEAGKFGETCAHLMNAYNQGFGEADLSNDG